LRRPLLPSHYSVWFAPPDAAGDELLHVVSERRSMTLKGYAFREFCELVVPMLDGRHTAAEIADETADVFAAADLDAMLDLLAAQGVLVEAPDDGLSEEAAERMTPQRNLFADVAPGEPLQRRLAAATVTIIGLGGAGPAVALGLAAAGIGEIRCLDALPARPADVYLSPALGLDAVGASRAERVADLLRAAAPEVKVVAVDQSLANEEEVQRAVAGSDYVVNCLDASQSNLAFKINKVCFTDQIPWISCALSGVEVIVGPTVHPGQSACYMCYRMRAVACSGNPENAFAYERELDRRRRDDGDRRENLVFSAGIAGNLLACEVVKELSGLAAPSLVGRILTVRLTDLHIEQHAVLRKPACPVCFPSPISNPEPG
jgi:bacteriocin biosynthesis cyclodehydratase domain-containing protein